MFYSERRRRQQIADQEAAGSSVWSDIIPAAFRVKLNNLGDIYNREVNDLPGTPYSRTTIYATAQKLLTSDMGKRSLRGASDPKIDFLSFLEHCDDAEFPNVLESLYAAIRAMDVLARSEPLCVAFEKRVNKLLEDYRISYSMHEGEVIPFTSREIHTEVTLPTLQLLTNPKWRKVEAGYQDALRQLHSSPGDAITDATTALQDGLRLLGCKGSDLKALLKSAKSTILKAQDEKLVEAIDQLIKWTSAIRASEGDVHARPDTSPDRAWLVIHIVGILLLYLSRIAEEPSK